ncbi:MAG TPA: hypothetical protein VHY10_16220 [Xanthobacteraceae bacterium]|jgi:hypothetical protein|nr:hypothetical protein [Xanthobacteraceae bacterium]
MGRPGRKRRGFRREKNGRAQRQSKEERVEEAVRVARSQPHRRSLKSNDRVSELAESPLGRLLLARRAAQRQWRPADLAALRDEHKPGISPTEFAAGELFAKTVGRYRGVIEGPRPMRSLMPETTSEHADEESAGERFACPSRALDPAEKLVRIGNLTLTTRTWPCQLPGEVCICAERRDRYMRAYEAVASAGRRALMAVIAVAVRCEEIQPQELVYLKAGLQAAARYLHLRVAGD